MLDMVETYAHLLMQTESLMPGLLESVQVIKEELLVYIDDHALVLAESCKPVDGIL